MADLDPSGANERVRHLVREGLSGMASFRTWLGVATQALARAQIVLDADQETLPDRPFVVLLNGPGSGGRRAAAEGTFVPRGTLRIAVFGAIAEAYKNDEFNANRSMLNQWGELLGILAALSGQDVDGNRLWFSDTRPADGGEPGFIEVSRHDDNQSKFEAWEAVAELDWGPEE